MQIGLILSVLMQRVIVFYAQRLFKQDNSRVNRHNLHECKRFYKHLIRPKKYNFQLKNLDSIERLKHCIPKEFGKYFKPPKDKKKSSNKIALYDFYAYFSNLENDIFQNTNADSDTFCNTTDFNHINVDNDVDDLDTCIIVDEINLVVKN